MAGPFVPVPYPVERCPAIWQLRHGIRRTSSLSNLSVNSDSSLSQNAWVKPGLRKMNSLDCRASRESLYERPPLATLVGYEVMEERAKFTVYKVLVSREPDESWVIFRGYTDFCRLNDKLKEVFPKFRLALPPKRWFKDNYDMNFLEERQLGLHAFLQNLVAHKDVTNSDAVRAFLCLDDPPGPFDSLEESRAYCETLEETNHRLQRELLDKQRELDSLRTILEDRQLQISRLEKTKNGICSAQEERSEFLAVHVESSVEAGVNAEVDTEEAFIAVEMDYTMTPDRSLEIQLPKRGYGACWSGPSTENQECAFFQTSEVLEDQV
ncbi:sorting nexin-16-like [Astyanax mexicanus]|uniref:Sorting nexin-16 n=1 Tax=Astyanax mexicanus TaxID=7994 RepID=A0A8T2LV84_ASTMX|nr:sorting nexin-16-like [Astyanax mexicanus]